MNTEEVINIINAHPSVPSLTSTQIGFGDGSNLLSGDPNFTWNGSLFHISSANATIEGALVAGGGSGNISQILAATRSMFEANGNTGLVTMGDAQDNGNGNVLTIDDINGVSYFDNIDPINLHTTKVGINTTTPTVALDVTGDMQVIGSTNNINFTISDTDGGATLTHPTNQAKLGINVSSPTKTLDIFGDAKVQGDVSFGDVSGGSGQTTIILTDGSNLIELNSNNVHINGNAQVSGAFMPNGDAGTLGFVLKSGGTGIAPTWTAPATMSYVAKTANYTLTASDVVVDATSGTFTLTLPTAVGITGKSFNIKNSGTGVITIATTSSQTIDGTTTKILNTQYSGYQLVSNNTNWAIIGVF